jgi:hypothetical protein
VMQFCGSGILIPDPNFFTNPGSRFLSIPDPTTATKEEGEKLILFCSLIFHKLKIILILMNRCKKIESIDEQ